jgi:hypothetical protein
VPWQSPGSLLAAWERGIGEEPLSRAVTLLAAATGDSPAEAAEFDVGSRDAVLLDLLRGPAGSPIWGTASCSGCGQRLDVPVDLDALPRSRIAEPGAVYEIEVAGRVVRFRLPTTADLMALTGPADHARAVLLRRCLVDDTALTDRVADAVEQAVDSISPGTAVEVTATCPGCGATTRAGLDLPLLVWTEVQAQALALLAEVHALAAAYGWTEPEVLALSPVRRAAYLELVDR